MHFLWSIEPHRRETTNTSKAKGRFPTGHTDPYIMSSRQTGPKKLLREKPETTHNAKKFKREKAECECAAAAVSQGFALLSE